ncbi:hypothetical protein COU58_00800 [Candidatus Pacearchaeota archaeon CG10_big_fil_rev_8_21_14_0_10_32_42]|nr:MAG: hypothetical protein COU58_00800 [Candidatus Pacearchaeota archaeon CG10_big_fil_rev_8_21_14_0_10_32_42]
MKKKGVVKKNDKRRVSPKFAGILAVISIVGFSEIVLRNFFEISIQEYSSFLWFMIMGIGFLIISKPRVLYQTSKKHFDEGSFSRLTTFVVGIIAIIAGVLSLPFVDINHPILFASMGIISIISIIFIIVQTWIIRN